MQSSENKFTRFIFKPAPYHIPFESNQQALAFLLFDTKTIGIIFADKFQIRNLSTSSLIHQYHKPTSSYHSSSGFAVTSPTSFAYVSHQKEKTEDSRGIIHEYTLYLVQYNWKQKQRKILTKLSQEDEVLYGNVQFLKDIGKICIFAENWGGQQPIICFWDKNKSQTYYARQRQNLLEKYNQSYIVEVSRYFFQQNSQFYLFNKSHQSETFQIKLENRRIIDVWQHSKDSAILMLSGNQKYSSTAQLIVLFSLTQKSILKTHKITQELYPYNFLSHEDRCYYFRLQKTSKGYHIRYSQMFTQNVYFDQIFGSNEWKYCRLQNLSDKCLLYYLKRREEQQGEKRIHVCVMEKKMENRKWKYIYLMEQIGVVEEFSGEIMKEVINNLF